jgi:hypothetical protein
MPIRMGQRTTNGGRRPVVGLARGRVAQYQDFMCIEQLARVESPLDETEQDPSHG